MPRHKSGQKHYDKNWECESVKLDLDTALDFVKQHPKLVVSEDFELVTQKMRVRSLGFKNGERMAHLEDSFWWIQLRIWHRKRVGTASTVFCDEENLNLVVENAFQIADNMMVDPWFRFPLWRNEKKIVKGDDSKKWAQTEFESAFFDSLFPLITVCPTGLEEKYTQIFEERVVARKTEKSCRFLFRDIKKINYSLINEGAGGYFRIDESKGFQSKDVNKKDLLESLLRRANRLKTGRKLNKMVGGKYILGGSVVSVVLKSLEPMLNGYCAALGKSIYSQSIDKDIGSKVVSLVDDGSLDAGEGSHLFDLEGTPGQRTELVHEGRLRTFLHDATSAARFNRASSGNLVLTEGRVPSIGVTNFFLQPSSVGLGELFREMREGIFIEGIERAEKELTRDGKLRVLAYGWRVSGGSPVESLGQIPLVVDPFEIMKEISMVGSDLDFWGRYGSPSVFIEKMPLGEV